MKRFWGKNYQTLLWLLTFKEWKGVRTRSFSYENYFIRILEVSSKVSLIFVNPSMHILLQKNVLFLLTIIFKYTLFPLNHPFSPKYSFLRKMQTLSCRGECRVRILKKWHISYFSLYLFTDQSWYILLKNDSEKRRFEVFTPKKFILSF